MNVAARLLLGEDVERLRVNVAVDQDNLALRPMHERNQKLEAFAGRALRATQPVVDAPDLLEHVVVVRDEVAHLHEGVHDLDAHLYRRLASEDG